MALCNIHQFKIAVLLHCCISCIFCYCQACADKLAREMADYGYPPQFPAEEQEKEKKEEETEIVIKDKAKGKKVYVLHVSLFYKFKE